MYKLDKYTTEHVETDVQTESPKQNKNPDSKFFSEVN